MHLSKQEEVAGKSSSITFSIFCGPLCCHPGCLVHLVQTPTPCRVRNRKAMAEKWILARPGLKNAPTCYRAPRWPDPEFPRKIPKKYPPGPKFWTPKKIPQRYQKNTKNAHFFGILGVFFRYFRGIFGVNSGSPEFRAGGHFFGIFRGNSGSGHLGAL